MKTIPGIILMLVALWANAHPSVSLIMDSRGNVYYSDLKQVWKIDVHGKKTVVVHNVHTHELYLDKDDNLFGEHLWYNGETANTWGHYIWKLTINGTLEQIKPPTVAFMNDYSFVHDDQGRMYWADRTNTCQKLIRKNKDDSITKLGDQCFGNIRWITATPDGTVYLMDLFDLKKVDSDGHVTTLAGSLQKKDREPNSVMGICTDKQSNVYVAVTSEHLVKKITPSGSISITAETRIPWSPSGILMAPNGDCWILECSITNAVRVEKISADGKRTIY